jgi:hypothetical protein
MVVGSSVGALNGAYYAGDHGAVRADVADRALLVSEPEDIGPEIEYYVVPPLCPLVGSPYDFSRTSDHIERAIASTDAWLAQGGLQKVGIPEQMRPHAH